jgi:hypothetical protein
MARGDAPEPQPADRLAVLVIPCAQMGPPIDVGSERHGVAQTPHPPRFTPPVDPPKFAARHRPEMSPYPSLSLPSAWAPVTTDPRMTATAASRQKRERRAEGPGYRVGRGAERCPSASRVLLPHGCERAPNLRGLSLIAHCDSEPIAGRGAERRRGASARGRGRRPRSARARRLAPAAPRARS